jgi:hypothetical protein
MPAEPSETHDDETHDDETHVGATHDDFFEERLARALHDTGTGFETHQDLAAAGEARGRTLLMRRRAAVLAGAAAVVCAAVSGALLLPGNGSADGRRSVADAPTDLTAPAGPSRAAGPSEPAVPSEAARGDITAEEMLATLKGLLPKGTTRDEHGRGTDAQPPLPSARLVYDDGKGGGAILVGLRRVEPESPRTGEITTCPDETFVAHDACRTKVLADGSTLMILQGYEYPDRRADTRWWAAELVTPQGHHVSVHEWNAEAQKDAPVSRPLPPLSTGRLEKLATAGAWRALADALPVPEGTRGDRKAPAQAPGADIRATLVSLLPDGVDVTKQGGQQDGFAYLVADDGRGASMVQVNVQGDMSESERQLFAAGTETLPDGTKVTQHQGPGEKGGKGVVMWTVDTIRPDGMRVVVSAFNSGAQHTAATRGKPVLTMEQLRAIAVSPKWRDLL